MAYRATEERRVWATTPYAEFGRVYDSGLSGSRARLYGGGMAESDFSIPRPSVYQERQRTEVIKESYANEVETYNEIVERISDEFRFLEERRAFSQKADSPRRKIHVKFPLRYRQYLFGSLAILQILVAIGMFIFAIVRYIRLVKLDDHKDMLFDFIKSEDFVETNQAGADVIAFKLGAGLFAPTIFQFCTGVAVLFAVYRNPPFYLLVLTIFSSIFSIILWMEPLSIAALELNLRNVQLRTEATNLADYRLLVALTALLAIDVLVITSLLLIYTSSQAVNPYRSDHYIVDLHINVITLILAAIALVLSVYSISNSMVDVNKWPKSPTNLPTLYGIGLRESIISGYVFLAVLFSTMVSVLKFQSLRLSSLFLQGISLFVLVSNLLNADRITAVTHNVGVMFNAKTSVPFTGEILLLLYIFILLLGISLMVQLCMTSANVFKNTMDSYSTPRKISYREYQRSAL